MDIIFVKMLGIHQQCCVPLIALQTVELFGIITLLCCKSERNSNSFYQKQIFSQKIPSS